MIDTNKDLNANKVKGSTYNTKDKTYKKTLKQVKQKIIAITHKLKLIIPM